MRSCCVATLQKSFLEELAHGILEKPNRRYIKTISTKRFYNYSKKKLILRPCELTCYQWEGTGQPISKCWFKWSLQFLASQNQTLLKNCFILLHFCGAMQFDRFWAPACSIASLIMLAFIMEIWKYLVINWWYALSTFIFGEMLKANTAEVGRIEWTPRRIQNNPGSQHLLADHTVSLSIFAHPSQAGVCIPEWTIHSWVKEPCPCEVHKMLDVTLPNETAPFSKRYSLQVTKATLHASRRLLFQLWTSSFLNPVNQLSWIVYRRFTCVWVEYAVNEHACRPPARSIVHPVTNKIKRIPQVVKRLTSENIVLLLLTAFLIAQHHRKDNIICTHPCKLCWDCHFRGWIAAGPEGNLRSVTLQNSFKRPRMWATLHCIDADLLAFKFLRWATCTSCLEIWPRLWRIQGFTVNWLNINFHVYVSKSG